jgi:NAD(P)-dependent dehydrogenase (short-subunit alcohol dehydrogenase family)
MKTAIVIGVGPNRGLGAQLCKRFAANGLKVVVAGRTPAAIETIAQEIGGNGGQAVPVVADATSEGDIKTLFDTAGDDLDLAIYNAGNNTPGRIIDMDADYFERSWRVACFGGFLFGREAIRRMVPKKAGTILFTGASASLRGRPNYGAFNSAKAGLRTLAQVMAKEYAEDGIHVGQVIVDGRSRETRFSVASRTRRAREASLISIVDGFAIITFDSLAEGLGQKRELKIGSRHNQFIDILSDTIIDPGMYAWMEPTQLRVSKALQEKLSKGGSNHFIFGDDGKRQEALSHAASLVRLRPD